MKKLLFLLLFPLLSIAQPRSGNLYLRSVSGKPTITPTAVNDYAVDWKAKVVYRATSTTATVKWVQETDTNVVNFFLKQGQKGDTGNTGAQGIQGIPGKDGKDGVCPSCPPSGGTMTLPFIIVIGTGNDDTQVNAAITENRLTRKSIWFSGNVSTGTINLPFDPVELAMFGYGCTWTAKSGTTSLIKRVTPTDNTQANIMTGARFTIKGFRFNGSTSMTCLDLGPSYNSTIEENFFTGWGTGIYNRFSLNCLIQHNEFYCLRGDVADYGNWTGATNYNSQSNNTYRFFNRYRLMTGATVASASYAASGCKYLGNIFEWDKGLKLVESDFKMSTVVKDPVDANGNHVECLNGNAGANSGEAYFFIKGVGIAKIDHYYGQYAGCMVNADGRPGQLQVIVSGVVWTVVPSDGKLFYNAGNTYWIFRDNDNGSLNNPSALSGLFAGTPVTECTGWNCGYNKWELRTKGYDTGNKWGTSTPAAARVAGKPFQLTLTLKSEVRSTVHPVILAQTEPVYHWEFDTLEEAEAFADANPDFNATIN